MSGVNGLKQNQPLMNPPEIPCILVIIASLQRKTNPLQLQYVRTVCPTLTLSNWQSLRYPLHGMTVE